MEGFGTYDRNDEGVIALHTVPVRPDSVSNSAPRSTSHTENPAVDVDMLWIVTLL